ADRRRRRSVLLAFVGDEDDRVSDADFRVDHLAVGIDERVADGFRAERLAVELDRFGRLVREDKSGGDGVETGWDRFDRAAHRLIIARRTGSYSVSASRNVAAHRLRC